MKLPESLLAGVPMIYTSNEFYPGSIPSDNWAIKAQKISVVYAKELGADVFVAGEGNRPIPRSSYVLNPPKDPGRRLERVVEARFLATHNTPVPVVESARFGSLDQNALCERLDRGERFVLSYVPGSNGNGKYLIENKEQVHKIAQFVAKHPQLELDDYPVRPGEDMVISEYIQTPSRHFTSYRLLVSAAGVVIAASLLVSRHTKDSGELASFNKRGKTSKNLTFIRDACENPDSDDYLGSKHICSNLATNGSSIPLMGGERARPLTWYEQSIVRAHDLDPSRIILPENMMQMASIVGSYFGPEVDCIVGVDLLQDQNNTRYYLESNKGPGAGTYSQ